MVATPHLIQRGSTYHWRRRLPRLSTIIGMLQISLGTTDRRLAITLARRLTAESDRMLDDIRHQTLSPADATKWLRHVVTDEMARIKRNRAILFADGDADPRMDWAMAEAWRILARRGPGAVLRDDERAAMVADCRSEADIRQLELSLDMLSRDLRSESQVSRMARSYSDMTGQTDPVGAAVILALRKLLIEGKAAAWSNVPADQGFDIASEIASSIATEMVAAERLDYMGAIDAPVHTSELETQTAPAMPAPPPARVAPPVAQPAPDEPEYDPSISAVIERLVAQKGHAGTSSVTQRQYKSFGSLFTQITGVTDVRDVRKSHCARFREILQKMPKSWGKSPSDAAASLDDMLAKARELPPEKVGLSAGTINRHLDHLGQMLEQASDDGIMVDEKLNPKRLRVAEEKRDRDKRASFRKPELEELFRHSIWTGCHSEARRNHPGDQVIRDGLFWIPILAAYTGARREELAALTINDIQLEDGIHFINIEENANRGLKNFSSVRKIPIHERLIELGFLTHVNRIRKPGGDLFPELRPAGYSKDDKSKKYGDRIHYAWSEALKKALAGNPRALCLHSMRHYVRDQLALDPSIPEKVRYDLIGHEATDVDTRTYGEASPLTDLRIAVNKLPVVI